MNKDMMSIFNKVMFPSGNINIENIIKELEPPPKAKDENNTIVIDQKPGIVDVPINVPEHKSSRAENRKNEKIKKTLSIRDKEKERKKLLISEKKQKLNELKKDNLFNEDDKKRLERILFQK
jgi:hypothetical protein